MEGGVSTRIARSTRVELPVLAAAKDCSRSRKTARTSDREFTGALLFPALEACRKLCADLPENAVPAEVFSRAEIRAIFQERLQSFAAASTGSSTRVERVILLDSPPSIEVQEMTDKGSINQKAVLKNRAGMVEDLYRDPVPAHVLEFSEDRR